MSEAPNIVGPESTLNWTKRLFKAAKSKPTKDKPNPVPMHSITNLYTAAAMASPLGVALKAAVDQAAIDKFGKAAYETMVAEGTFRSPFRKDLSNKGYDRAVFECFVESSCGEDYPPPVVRNVVGADGKRIKITDPKEVYSGAKGHTSYSIRLYGGPGTGLMAGASLDLRGVVKTGDGPRIAGGGSGDPDSDFASIAAGKAPSVEGDASLSDFLK